MNSSFKIAITPLHDLMRVWSPLGSAGVTASTICLFNRSPLPSKPSLTSVLPNTWSPLGLWVSWGTADRTPSPTATSSYEHSSCPPGHTRVPFLTPGLTSLLGPQRMMARAARMLHHCRSHSNGERAGSPGRCP